LVLADKCQRCHQDPPENGAPFPLLSYADTQVFYPPAQNQTRVVDTMQRAIETGFMPPVGVQLDPAVEPLTGDEEELLLDWLESGANGPECPEQP
jgi:hypothetical protein